MKFVISQLVRELFLALKTSEMNKLSSISLSLVKIKLLNSKTLLQTIEN